MDLAKQFFDQVQKNIVGLGKDKEIQELSRIWLRDSLKHRYTYNFSWLGRPIIQYPQDIVAMQELIWFVKPDLIIETGIAHGGSLIFSASLMALLDLADAFEDDEDSVQFTRSKRKVVGVDIEIRPHNRQAIENHPLTTYIQMIEGSSIAIDVIEQVKAIAKNYQRILISLDSMHTHDHVLAELEAYAPLTSKGSYCVVFDTVIDDMPSDAFPDRPWGPGDNPKTAVREYLKKHPEFEIGKQIQNKLLITVAPDGFLRKLE